MTSASVLFDAPGPRARVRNHIATGITLLVLGVIILLVLLQLWNKDQLEGAKWKPFITPDVWLTYIIPGIEGTLKAAGISIVLALALGLLLGVGRLSTLAL